MRFIVSAPPPRTSLPSKQASLRPCIHRRLLCLYLFQGSEFTPPFIFMFVMAGSQCQHMRRIMEDWQRSARTVLSQFAIVPPNESFERRRQDHIVRTTGIRLEDCNDLWEFCRKKRQLETGWRPRGQPAWQYAACMDYVDCWLYADGCSNRETSTPLQIGEPGVWWPVVVGLPYPTPPDWVFPYACQDSPMVAASAGWSTSAAW